MKVDVCVIGSGVAGGVVCAELLSAGVKDVLMLEQGGAVPMQDQRRWEDLVMQPDLPVPFVDVDLPLEFVNLGPTEYNASVLQARGGSTVHWGGLSLRLKPEDFRLKTNTGIGVDWPISYDQLQPFYDEADRTLQVAAQASDPGHPPLTGPFPLPAFPYQLSDDPFIRAMDSLGYSVQHSCQSRNTLPINGRPQCQTFGTCLYCPLGARFTGDQLIDRLEQRAGFRLQLHSSVQRILFDSRDRAIGLEVVDLKTKKVTRIEAETIVVCAGGLQSPKLLLQSTSQWWPKGVGNAHDNVGRFLMNHLASGRYGAVTQNADNLWDETFAFSTVLSRHFDSSEQQANGKFILIPSLLHPNGPTRLMLQNLDVETINEQYGEQSYFRMEGLLESFPSANNFVGLSKEKGADGTPKLDITFSFGEPANQMAAFAGMLAVFEKVLLVMGCETVGGLKQPGASLVAHHMGTCRMSISPEGGVVDENLRVHGTTNLFVCSSAVFPTSGAVNPTATIVALAHRLGKHLVAQRR